MDGRILRVLCQKWYRHYCSKAYSGSLTVQLVASRCLVLPSWCSYLVEADGAGLVVRLDRSVITVIALVLTDASDLLQLLASQALLS